MRQRLGTVVSVLGALLLVAGAALSLTGDDKGDTGDAQVAATTTSTESTTSVSPTSNPTVETETVEDFFAAFVEAIDAGDVAFLLDRLHPIVLDQPTADACPSFVEREILALVDYRATGPVEGPEAAVVGGQPVEELYTVPIAFEFQDEIFESVATLAALDGRMHWFAECR